MSTADTTTEAFANTRPSSADAVRDYEPMPRPVPIDYEEEMFEAIRSGTLADLVELNVRLLAKTAKTLYGMPSI